MINISDWIAISFLALMNRIAIRRHYVYPTFVSSICIIVVSVVNVLFKCYLLWSLRTDWLQMLCEASWCGSLPMLWQLGFLVCYYRCIRQNRPNVQTLSPLKIMNWLASKFMWDMLVWVSTKVMEIRIFGLLL